MQSVPEDGASVGTWSSVSAAHAAARDVVLGAPNLIRVALLGMRNPHAWQIIERRFGLGGARRLTLNELGNALQLSRERIRQIQSETLRTLATMLAPDDSDGAHLAAAVHGAPSVRDLYNMVLGEPCQAIREDVLLARLGLEHEYQRVAGTLELLFQIAGIHHIDPPDEQLAAIWVTGDVVRQRHIGRTVAKLHAVLTQQLVLPEEIFDLLVVLNRGRKKDDRLTLTELQTLIPLCSSLEWTPDGRVQSQFSFLQGRGNQAFRLLSEAGHSMLTADLARTVNARCVPLGQAKVNARNLSNQLSSDGRFEPIGKSGYWGLKSEDGARAKSIVDLMEHFLIGRDSCASADEMFAFVSEQRPVSRGSITMYLSFRPDKFAEIQRGCWGLASWRVVRGSDTWDRQQIADWIAAYFRQRRVREVAFEPLKEAFITATRFTERQTRGLLGHSPAMRTHRTAHRKRIAVFNPDYEKQLTGPRSHKPRRSKTLREQTSDRVRVILQSQPNHEISMGELLNRLIMEFQRPKATFYSYLAGLDFLECVASPGGGHGKTCRFKTAEMLSERAQQIHIVSLRQKVERALTYLNEEQVDVGLFLLSKEFEATLKTLLNETRAAGTLTWVPASDPSKWRLAEMVTVAEKNHFITDTAILGYLRQERNDRAHGTMPSQDERSTLMRATPMLAGLYIDYIALFANRTQEPI